MSWVEPKTNWVSTDYFNIEDYSRIVGNLLYLKDYVRALHSIPDFEPMEESKTYSSMIYASEMNAIENNLDTLNKNTYGYKLGDKKTYTDNGNTPDYAEFNRIESAQLKIYKSAQIESVTIPVLEFTLGLQEMEV